MSLDPRNHNWETGLEGGLPDCRVKAIERDRSKVRIGRIELDLVFCANCGTPTGATWPDCPHIFYVCDDCVRANGEPPGTVRVGGQGIN